MQPKEVVETFDEKQAFGYDDKWSRLSAMKDALHLFTRVVFSDLPADARILCVGVGTGAELFSLADHYPNWTFTGVEPAGPMLDVCKAKSAERGISSRCQFHEGFLETLPRDRSFDGATCFLVSQFITDKNERQAFFSDLGSRLAPGGALVSADISGDRADPHFDRILTMWSQMMRYAKLTEEEVASTINALGSAVAVISPEEMEILLRSAGFIDPTPILQTLLVRAWVSRRRE